MLFRFRVANYRSIRQEQELSLVATELNDGTARATGVRADGREIKVLPVAGIYGANASGKSNVLLAIRPVAVVEAVGWRRPHRDLVHQDLQPLACAPHRCRPIRSTTRPPSST